MRDIKRKFLSTLNIKIIERHPTALLKSKNNLQVIDADGKIIGPQEGSKFSHLIIVSGDGSELEAINLTREVNRIPLPKNLKIKGGIYVSRRRWDLVFDNGLRVKMPEDYHEYPSRFKVLIELLDKKHLQDGAIQRIDLRDKSRVYLDVSQKIKSFNRTKSRRQI